MGEWGRQQGIDMAGALLDTYRTGIHAWGLGMALFLLHF